MTEFWVWNDTDGIPANPEAFATRQEAEAFCAEYRERFAERGYVTRRWECIPSSEIELRIEEVPVEPEEMAS